MNQNPPYATASVLKQLLAHHSAIGPAYGELLCLLCAESDQVVIGAMATALAKTRRSVAGNIRHLEKQGIIERRCIPGQANKYIVRLSEESK